MQINRSLSLSLSLCVCVCGVWHMGHVIRTCSAVCSKALLSQFGEGARPHLCMDE